MNDDILGATTAEHTDKLTDAQKRLLFIGIKLHGINVCVQGDRNLTQEQRAKYVAKLSDQIFDQIATHGECTHDQILQVLATLDIVTEAADLLSVKTEGDRGH